MATNSKHKRWATAGLTLGLMIGGGALANAATSSGSTSGPATVPAISVSPSNPSPPVKAVSTPVVAPQVSAINDASTALEAKDVPGAAEVPDAAEAADPTEKADGTDVAGAKESDAEAGEAEGESDANEAADSGVDCENGLVRGTSTSCDGGPSANQDGGNEVSDTNAK